jgi:hypothetical protein
MISAWDETRSQAQPCRVLVPEWGGHVWLHPLSARQHHLLEAALAQHRGREDDEESPTLNLRARVVAMSARDDEGHHLFGPQDIPLLAEKSARALDRLYSICQEISGLRTEGLSEVAKKLRDAPERLMWFRLASLWGCTVREAQERCPPEEFSEWLAFYSLEPWGCEAEDVRHAILTAAVSSLFSKKQADPKNFLPPWSRQKGVTAKSPEEMASQLKAAANQMQALMAARQRALQPQTPKPAGGGPSPQ